MRSDASRPRTSVFIGTSLDGFIARPDDAIDWLEDVEPTDDPDEDFGWSDFWPTVDALMGRRTWEVLTGFDEWPYGDTPVWVLTTHPDDVSAPPGASVRTVAGPPAEVLDTMAADGIGHVYVDGGETIQQFLRARLVDRMVITTLPVLIGEGIPLFGPSDGDVALRLEAVRQWPNSMVQRTYAVVPAGERPTTAPSS
jgi:dihydrofolate reductase